MATFGSYTLPRKNTNGNAAPSFSSWADYSYSRIDNSYLSVTITVYMQYTGSGGYVGSGTGASITATMSSGGVSGSGTIKAAGTNWSNIPKNTTYSASTTLTVPSSSAGSSISVSYSISNGGASWVTFASVPTQSTSFSSPALLWTPASIWGLSASISDSGTGQDVTLSWSAANGTNNAITEYHVYWNTGTYCDASNAVGSMVVYSNSCTIYRCTRGTTYAFMVYAIAPYGNVASNVATASIVSVSAPTVNSISLSRSEATLYVSWSASNGSYNPISSYTLTVYNSAWSAVFSANVGNVTSYSLNVARGTSYIAYVTAHGQYSDSSAPNSSWVEVPVTTAPSVYDYKLTRNGTTLTATWSGANGQENPIQTYYFSVVEDGVAILLGQPTTSTSYTFQGTRGKTYWVEIQAHGITAVSDLVTTEHVLVPEITAPKVTGATISRVGTTLTASWSGEGGVDNDLVDYYIGLRRSDSNVNLQEGPVGTSTSVTYTVERGYSYQVHIVPRGKVSNGSTYETEFVEVPNLSIPIVSIDSTQFFMNTVGVSFTTGSNADPIDTHDINAIKLYLCEPDIEDYSVYLQVKDNGLLPRKGFFYNLDYSTPYKIFVVLESDGGEYVASSNIITTINLSGTYVRQNGAWTRTGIYVYQNGAYENASLCVKNDSEDKWQTISNTKIEEVE